MASFTREEFLAWLALLEAALDQPCPTPELARAVRVITERRSRQQHVLDPKATAFIRHHVLAGDKPMKIVRAAARAGLFLRHEDVAKQLARFRRKGMLA